MKGEDGLRGESLRILLVEDNPAHAELVRRSFEDHLQGNELRHISDGETALDYLFRRGSFADEALPHLVLLDLRLPRIDGLEVLREMKGAEEVEKIPVVMLTTSNAEQDVDRAYAYGANSYLVKPVDFERFSELMKTLRLYWMNWNEYPR